MSAFDPLRTLTRAVLIAQETMHIHGKHIVLRALEESDFATLQTWANDPTIQSMLAGWHFPVSSRDQQTWLDRQTLRSNDQRFGVTACGTLVGTASLVGIDWQNGHGYHGMLLGKESRGNGYAVDTVMTIMRFAFDELRLQRLDSDIIANNGASLKLYTGRCGWRAEGVKRGWFFRTGQRWDSVVVGVTASDYQELCERTRYWD